MLKEYPIAIPTKRKKRVHVTNVVVGNEERALKQDATSALVNGGCIPVIFCCYFSFRFVFN